MKKKILILDDDAGLRRSLALPLSPEFALLEAADAWQALILMTQERRPARPRRITPM